MKRFMIAVVVVGVLFNTGPSFAQDEDAPQIPEKVRKFLDNFVGRWEFEGSSKGTCRIYWDSSKTTLVSNVQFERQGIPSRCLAMWYWDGISEDRIIGSWAFSNKKGFSQIRQEWVVLSEKVCEGPRTGVLYGKELTARSRIEFTGSDKFTWSLTNLSVGGEMQPDMTDFFTRLRPTTRKDFEEFCELFSGRWGSETIWTSESDGFATKGKKITAYLQNTVSQDGNAFTMNFVAGKESAIWLIAYDSRTRQIKGMNVRSTSGTGYVTVYKANGKWWAEMTIVKPDGTKTDLTLALAFTEDGNTHTVKTIRSSDDGIVDTPADVYRRLSE